MSEKVGITSLLKKDLYSYVEKLELINKFEDKQITCQECDEVLTIDEVGIIYYVENKPQFTCNKVSCYRNIKILED